MAFMPYSNCTGSPRFIVTTWRLNRCLYQFNRAWIYRYYRKPAGVQEIKRENTPRQHRLVEPHARSMAANSAGGVPTT
ncbi:hypothetical protein OUZ56_022722 [Daphnia magna]|uniref:Uncharacterized protein n=1 Tax=Daphnia magna TaxID=35525 RepID=A0ABR0AXA2_9CRUS|nr:hypothetical protein OUZ56_022722 [Daphnia magna]